MTKQHQDDLQSSTIPAEPSTSNTPKTRLLDSVYRVIGFGDRAKRMALYDIPRDDTVWVNTTGYDDRIDSSN